MLNLFHQNHTAVLQLSYREIFIHWICRFGSPIQIHSDNGTEFVNKLSKELFKLLEIKHTTTTPGHPQCNAQAEVFNKTMAKYLASFVDESTLDWEQYLPALQFSYNTSYHSTIQTTPFELLYGMKPRTPSIPIFSRSASFNPVIVLASVDQFLLPLYPVFSISAKLRWQNNSVFLFPLNQLGEQKFNFLDD